MHNTNYEELYKHIPKDILPSEYGGTAGSTEDILGMVLIGFEAYHIFLKKIRKLFLSTYSILPLEAKPMNNYPYSVHYA